MTKAVSYEKYYRDQDYEDFESLFSNIFQKRFNLIKRFVNSSGKVLDIGASTGIFLNIFKNKGWEVWGVEPSMSSNIAKKRGIKMINSYFENASLPKNNFDLIVMNHTLEHIKDAAQVIKKTHSLLKSDGILFIDVPNAGGIGAKILNKNWPYLLPEEHIHQFTKESLSNLLKLNGYKVVYWESRSGVFEYANPLRELLRSLLTLKKRFFTDILTFPYASVATLLNNGDSMSFIAKKI